MGRKLSTLILFMLGLFTVQGAVADTRDRVPLFDCGIFEDYRDQRTCQNLTRGESVFELTRGTVDCYSLRRGKLNMCLAFAEALNYNPRLISCRNISPYDHDRRRLCESTRRAYQRGRTNDHYDNVTSSTTTTVITQQPEIVTQVHTTNTCTDDGYDRAVTAWRIKKEEQKRRAQATTAVGVGVGILGLILQGSNDHATSTAGSVLAIGGALVTTYGLIELVDANVSLPHIVPGCQGLYVTETRRVVVERQTCTTTRYSHQSYRTSRYYYEVNCSNKRFVTFEEFQPWHSGVRY